MSANPNPPAADSRSGPLASIRVVEIADELAEYCGLLLGGLGAEVVKVEPAAGNSTRHIGPFYGGVEDPERSLFFWHYNRTKRSVVLDLENDSDRQRFTALVGSADVVLDSTPRGRLADDLSLDRLRAADDRLVTARMTPFGDTGPWADWRGSDLVHLALGGPMMNCGYDPLPNGNYDLPPIAPQMWHSYHIAGEQLAMMIVAALVHRQASGLGQHLSCAVHEAVAKSTELDLMNWVMRAAPLHRQTCRHAAEKVSPVPTIAHTKDGRWLIASSLTQAPEKMLDFLDGYGLGDSLRREYERAQEESGTGYATAAAGRPIPGSGNTTELASRFQESLQRLMAKFSYADAPWREAQEAGLWVAPLRLPEENVADEHWVKRGSFAKVRYPELDAEFTDVTSKWISTETPWQVGRRAPLLDEDAALLGHLRPAQPAAIVREPVGLLRPARPGAPLALQGVRIFDFSWFLASAGGTRFLAALGADVIKVEWKEHPDTRMGAMAPVGGRAARAAATGPLWGITDTDMGGQFNNKNSGKRGISLNVRHPKGLEIARQLISLSDIVAEGFSPGVLDRWGLGYDELCRIKPDIIYAQQSGMGAYGTYGRFRSVGPIAAAFAGTAEMSGLPEPAMPVSWGYSYLDWLGAYSFALAILAALHHRNATGQGQWIDASQCEAGLFAAGTAYLSHSANGERWQRHGNRAPYMKAAPHGAYRCSGSDVWLAIACFDDKEWHALAQVAGRPGWLTNRRFGSLADRLANQDELDTVVSEWARTQDGYVAMTALQAAGVAAGVCQTAADRCDRDPQLAHLGWLTEVTGSKIGTWPVAEVAVRMSGTPATVAGPTGRGAPCYGEDNEDVLGGLLGMTKDEIADLEQEGVI
jgi:crotonobetainyl-CoA:carnitine CoA-transferase CaiB-like acyl-CoA transferase